MVHLHPSTYIYMSRIADITNMKLIKSDHLCRMIVVHRPLKAGRMDTQDGETGTLEERSHTSRKAN